MIVNLFDYSERSPIMNKTTRYTLALMALTLICVSAHAADKPNPFIGRWALTIPGGGAGWLGVQRDGAGYKSQILWGGGSVVPVTETEIEGDTLTLIRRHNVKRKDADGKTIPVEIIEKITAKVNGDNLLLTRLYGRGGDKREFTAERIPPLPPRPDLSKVKYAKPITLFDGSNKNAWKLTNPGQTDGWSVQNGILVNNPTQQEGEPHISYGNLRTKDVFEDFNLKLEVNVAKRGNSGIYLRGIYEVQVSDSYGKPLNSHNMGGIYSRIKPTVNAEKKAGQWQKFDITLLNRHVTVKLNGKTIIDNQPLLGCTGGALWPDQFKPGPIYLQGDHSAISYRNIVITPIIKTKTAFVEDTFDGKLGPGWTWLREDKPAWRISNNALEIRVQPGVAHNVKNALLIPAPDRREGKYAVDVTITNLTKPTNQYEQAGITWYNNGKPVFKLVKELVKGKVVIVPSFKPMPSSTVQLRLIVNGSDYTMQFRPDAKGEFQTAAKGKLLPPRNDQVSIQCYNGPPNAEHWIRFDNFRITKLID